MSYIIRNKKEILNIGFGGYNRTIKSIKIKDNNPDVHVNYGTQLLMMENFDQGFEEYEWRKKSKSFSDYIDYRSLNLKSKVWNGEDIFNKKFFTCPLNNIFIEITIIAEFGFPSTTTYNICLLYTSPSPRDQRGSGLAAWA